MLKGAPAVAASISARQGRALIFLKFCVSFDRRHRHHAAISRDLPWIQGLRPLSTKGYAQELALPVNKVCKLIEEMEHAETVMKLLSCEAVVSLTWRVRFLPANAAFRMRM